MPYNSNGVHSLDPGYKAITGQDILPSQHNPPLEDVSGSLSMVYVKDGRAPMTGDIPMGGNRITGLAPGVNPTDAATVGQAAYAVGDGKWSLVEQDETWLRRDGSLYDVDDYPDLAALLPALPDGVTWGNVAPGVTGTMKSVIATVDGFFIATTTGNDTLIWKSADASAGSFAQIATVANIAANSLAYEGGVYIISGIGSDAVGKVSVSTDQTTWSAPVSPGIGNTVYGCSYNGSLYVAVGNGGLIASSPDLVSWTARTSGTTQGLRNVKYLNGNFVVTGLAGVVTTSSNGTTYTLRTTGTTENLFSAAYFNSLYISVGTNGKIITSPDLASWTSRTSGTTLTFNDVVASTSGLIAVGNTGVARISGNATTWSATVTGVSSNLISITFSPAAQHQYYALGNGSFIKGIRTLPTQFRVPDDDPDFGWVKALAA